MEPDFSGYATKAGLKCSDGRTITPEAFKHMHGVQVPLVWMHNHKDAENVLGHAVLEARADGVYAYGFFNKTKQGENAKALVEHKDIDKMSIYANQLVEKSKTVHHGSIREVSLVLAGANPGAKIDYVRIQHGDDPDDVETLEDEAVIHSGMLLHGLNEGEKDEVEEEADEDDEDEEDVQHADGEDETVQDVYDTLSEKQQNVVDYMIAAALKQASDNPAQHSAEDGESITHQEGTTDVTRNVFEQNGAGANEASQGYSLTHDDMKSIFEDARRNGSLKEAATRWFEKNQGQLQHGIESIETLFPDAKAIDSVPELIKRRTEWVANVLSGTRHTPFSRIKTLTADITQDEARAKGYIKGHFKKEEWFGVTKRTTSPTTVYKKQKLDRDDVLDITDFDVVAWLKGEMRLMLEEEIARSILIGDGRDISDEDKIQDPMGASSGNGIRSIINDHELYVTQLYVNVDDANSSYDEIIDAVMDGMEYYKGTGVPTLYTTLGELNKFKKAKDTLGRRLYENNAAVAEALGVDRIVTVEAMKSETNLVGIIVNLQDYNVGTDKGGEINLFDDFDIDYNQLKYLMETRMSGALVLPKSAIVIRKTAAANALVAPNKPGFNPATGVVNIPTQTGVVYKAADGTTTLTAGNQTALAAGASTTVYAVPATGYYFADNQNDSWLFKRAAS
jgi:HK97 family phage prohead protease